MLVVPFIGFVSGFGISFGYSAPQGPEQELLRYRF